MSRKVRKYIGTGHKQVQRKAEKTTVGLKLGRECNEKTSTPPLGVTRKRHIKT